MLPCATHHPPDDTGQSGSVLQVSDPQPVPEHGVTVVFVELPNTKIELLHPLGETSPIRKFLERNPAGIVVGTLKPLSIHDCATLPSDAAAHCQDLLAGIH